jgi:hypothetical protein
LDAADACWGCLCLHTFPGHNNTAAIYLEEPWWVSQPNLD